MKKIFIPLILCLALAASLVYAGYSGSSDSLNNMARKSVKCGVASGNLYVLGAELKNGVNIAFTFYDINGNGMPVNGSSCTIAPKLIKDWNPTIKNIPDANKKPSLSFM